jgi:phage-related protein
MTTNSPKPITFVGGSLDDLRAFLQAARRMAGFQLDRVQHGANPTDWKPMSDIGAGVREIRIHDADGAFRVIYVAKFADAVYVLHCFQKKSQRTGKQDIELAKSRYKQLLQDLKA